MDVAWGAWRPDVVGPNSGMAVTAEGVIPKPSSVGIGYGPAASLSVPASAVALDADPRGSISVQMADGSWATFVATAAKIEELQSDYTWDATIDTSRTVPDGDDVSFAKFGSYLLNSDLSDGLKAYNLETPAGNNSVSGAPAARWIYVSNYVVFALGLSTNERRFESTVQGTYDNWTGPGSDGLTYTEGGNLVCGFDLGNGVSVHFQDSACNRIQFGAAPQGALYTVTSIDKKIGALSGRSVVVWGGKAYWPTRDNFYETDGFTIQSIAQGKVKDWFFGKDGKAGVADLDALASMEGSIDPVNGVVQWRFKALVGTSDTVFDDLIRYHIATGEWTTASQQTTMLARLATTAVVADDLDGLGPADSIDIAMDDAFWQGSQPIPAALDASRKIAFFSGQNMAATIECAPRESGTSGLISRATPISDAPNSTLELAVASTLNDDLTYKAAASKQASGRVPLRGRGKVIAFRENIPAGEVWTYSNGVDHVEASVGGGR
jgi:hypothetical protein